MSPIFSLLYHLSSASSSSVFPAISLGFTILGEIFAYVTVSQFNHRDNHIQSSWMVHAKCVFVPGIQLSISWRSGSFEAMRWNTCVHRLDHCLYSHLKEFSWNGVRTHVNSKGKIPSTRGSEEDWTRGAASHSTASPTHYQQCYSSPSSLADSFPFFKQHVEHSILTNQHCCKQKVIM